MKKTYIVDDLNKGLLSGMSEIEADSPLEAAKKYIKSIGENRKVSRDLFDHGRLVVRGRAATYVYNVE